MTDSELVSILNRLRNQQAESECVEFKEAKQNFDFGKLGKYFSALSNEANLKNKECSWLIFGVKDKPLPREIVGSSFRSNRTDLDNLKGEVANKTTNRVTFDEIYQLSFPEGRVVMFQIPPAPKGIPVAWEGHYYGRDGEEIGALNIVEVERIRSQSTIVDWSAQIVPNATLDDLSQAAIAKAREEFKKKNPIKSQECDEWDDSTFLNKAKVTIQGKITNTAIILLGKEESAHFLNPAIARISWILKDADNIERDYQHFGPPFILASTEVFNKIRNLTYRYMDDASLFPIEIKTYEPFVIREALHNCIAHQDYALSGKISVVEKPDELVFTNVGNFIPGDVETVINQDSPQEFYRNAFLAEAMVNLNMIDTIGSGIKKMFIEQRKRFFPLPDYDLSDPNKVTVKIAGRIWDENYTKLLIQNSDLDLQTVILLDKVQKQKMLSKSETQQLRRMNLIEGRTPNVHIAASIAEVIGEKTGYIKNKGFDNEYYRDLIIKFIKKFNAASRNDLEDLLIAKLPDVLTEKQKKDKVKNAIQFLKMKGQIELNEENKWVIRHER